MVDIQAIRDNQQAFAEAIKNKGSTADLTRLLKLDDQRRQLIGQIENLRTERNQLAKKFADQPDQIADQGRQLKDQIVQFEQELKPVQQAYDRELYQVPALPSADTPVGTTEADNKILKQVGTKPQFDFKPKPHWQMPQFVDEARAVKISGSRFAFLKGDLVLLQFAVIQYCLDLLTDEAFISRIVSNNQLDISSKPFLPILPPTMMRTESYLATGRLQLKGDTFQLAEEDLWLTGSAEHALCAYYKDETLAEADLPIRLVGYNTAYRREVGSAGKDTRGILRQHQFDKLEMESFSSPQTSYQEHLLLVAIQEFIMESLDQPFQTVLKCTIDMGNPNIRGVDIETYMAGQDLYRETHSADYLGDFQTRGLNTRLRLTDGRRQLAHTNDATVFCGRPLVAILENNQLADGRVRVPSKLRPYLNDREFLQ